MNVKNWSSYRFATHTSKGWQCLYPRPPNSLLVIASFGGIASLLEPLLEFWRLNGRYENRHDNVEKLEILLRPGKVNINHRHKEGRSALYGALQEGRQDSANASGEWDRRCYG